MLELTDTGWDKLAFWEKPAWERLEDQLHDLKEPWESRQEEPVSCSPTLSFGQGKVVILGQDPYPNPLHATGVAFSIPDGVTPYPLLSRTFLGNTQLIFTMSTPKSQEIWKHGVKKEFYFGTRYLRVCPS